MHRYCYFVIILTIMAVQISCSRNISSASHQPEKQPSLTIPGPACIIYKTRADYRNNVAVSLSGDRKKITSYPGVEDIRGQGEQVFPVELASGYLLDNRGIEPGVAFLRLTYTEYAALAKTPTADSLYSWILDADPLLEMWSCGSRSEMGNSPEHLSERIRLSDFSGMRRLK